MRFIIPIVVAFGLVGISLAIAKMNAEPVPDRQDIINRLKRLK